MNSTPLMPLAKSVDIITACLAIVLVLTCFLSNQHEFRAPEKRPPVVVTTVFSVLVIVPAVILVLVVSTTPNTYMRY